LSAAVQSLLFLSHRLPYPPNKGDKVRSFHFLRHLAQRYRIFLATFIDDPADWQHLQALEAMCAEVHVERIVPRWRRAASLRGLLDGEALTLPYFRSRGLARWIDALVCREHMACAFAFSSPMAQYLLKWPRIPCVVDFVDMDSAKWGDFASRRSWPGSALYRREARRLLAFEQHVAAHASASTFVSDEESRLFRAAAPDCAGRVAVVPNGVDSEYFSPSHPFPSPFGPEEHPIVFTGAMDYWPNVDAAAWFAGYVLPQIRSRDPLARFYVVGMNPNAAVQALGRDRAVTVTGRVDDVRPYLRHARVVVAPLRVARGIQNKILEAMAMAKPVVASAASAASLSVRAGIDLEVASAAREFASKVLSLMDPPRAASMGQQARAHVGRHYAWSAALRSLDELLQAAAK
jgi:sugar transferase (PEP-CTERM/EpsH1 system associated)